jgi:hypothetical protein
MSTHHTRYRGSRVAVVTQLDANGLYSARSVTVQRKSGGSVVEEAVPYEVLAFKSETQAIREAITQAEAFIDKRTAG